MLFASHLTGRMCFRHVSAILGIVWLATTATAQLRPAFQWGWGDISSPQSFEECQTLSVIILESSVIAGTSSVGVGPYYMLAFEVDGVPTTSMIGSDPKNLWWQANHKRGSSLILTLVDSNGSIGGVPQPVYNITAGNDTSCLPSVPSSTAVVRTNVFDTISTCDALGLTVTGGQKPYTIVLAETHAATITTVSLTDDEDTLTYINRFDPGWQLIASVYDASGHWGTSSNAIRTSGISNNTCPGLRTTVSNSADAGTEDPPLSSTRAFPSGTSVSSPTSPLRVTSGISSSTNHKVAGIAVGVALGVGVPSLLAAVVLLLWLRSRRKASVKEMRPDIIGPPTSDVDPTMTEARPDPFMLRPPGSSPSLPTANEQTTPSSPRSPGARRSLTQRLGVMIELLEHATPTSMPTPRKRRLQLANDGPTSSPTTSSNATTTRSGSSQQTLLYQPGSSSSTASRMDPDEQGSQEVLVQHRDAGVVFRELPPPYNDISSPSATASTRPDPSA